MNVGIITVRKRWNNAPTSLCEGIKKGISSLIANKYDTKGVNFIFTPFTIHNPDKVHISPESVKDFDVIIIPFWIGDRIFKCNLSEIKEKNNNIKIVLYTGLSTYQSPAFDRDFNNRSIKKNNITEFQWKNFNCVDKFLVVKKLFPFEKEVEVGCGQFEEFFHLNKWKTNGVIIDFCKKNWDEFIWNDFRDVFDKIKNESNIELIQLGDYPFKVKNCGLFNRNFVHFQRLADLYSRSKIFIAMNESFGYPIIENKFAGNLVLVHENSEFPKFHLKSNNIISWNKNNISVIIKNFIYNYNDKTPINIREDFCRSYPELNSWENTVKRIIDELLLI